MSWPAGQPWNLLLKKVSRSFYLTLRVLPERIRPQIGLAYLLARTTDTIADTHLVIPQRRRAALREMRNSLRSLCENNRMQTPELGELAEAQADSAGRGSHAERLLLEHAADIIDRLADLGEPDRRLICELMETITRGQEADLVRFGAASRDRIEALDTDEELEEYTYCVAGCVGEFWTRMCRSHLFPAAELEETQLLGNGIRFGKGLQLVNILRDLPADLRMGRCYLPSRRLAEIGLAPRDLLDSGAMDRLRPLYRQYLEQAEELLAAGWTYTNALPHNQVRVRLACAWPALIGIRTLALLHNGNALNPGRRIKVSRYRIHSIVLQSLLRYYNRAGWNRLFSRFRQDRHTQSTS